MLNFPFLRDNKIHINLGVISVSVQYNLPGLFEVNICLLPDKIRCEFYDIFKYKQITYEPLMELIHRSIVTYKMLLII